MRVFDQLVRVAVAGDDDDVEPEVSTACCQRRDQVVGLVAREVGHLDPQRVHDLTHEPHLLAKDVGSGLALCLVLGHGIVPEGRLRTIEQHDDAIGTLVASRLISIDVKPNTAFVTWPDDVAMSVGNAKNARYVSELPSSSRSLATGRAYAAPPTDNSGDEAALEHLRGDGRHRAAGAHRGLLDEREGRGLAQLVLVHQHALGSVDHLAGLEPTGGVGHLALERDRLAVASEGELDGRHQLGARKGFTR